MTLWRNQYIFRCYFNLIKMPVGKLLARYGVSENFDLLHEYFTLSMIKIFSLQKKNVISNFLNFSARGINIKV